MLQAGGIGMDSVLARVKKKPLLSALALVLAGVLLFALFVMTRTPRLDRDWEEHLALMPKIEMSASDFSLGPATDWTYAAEGPTQKNTVSFAANYADLKNVWFMVEPQPGGDYAAH